MNERKKQLEGLLKEFDERLKQLPPGDPKAIVLMQDRQDIQAMIENRDYETLSPTNGTSSRLGPHESDVRAQVLEVIVKQALAGAPWREICAGPMQVTGITVEEVEAELERCDVSFGSGLGKAKSKSPITTSTLIIRVAPGRSWDVILDGSRFGSVGISGQEQLAITPGSHIVQLRSSGFRSGIRTNCVHVTSTAGSIVKLESGIRLPALLSYLAVLPYFIVLGIVKVPSDDLHLAGLMAGVIYVVAMGAYFILRPGALYYLKTAGKAISGKVGSGS
jgi:hypothetical protein